MVRFRNPTVTPCNYNFLYMFTDTHAPHTHLLPSDVVGAEEALQQVVGDVLTPL